MLLAVARLPNRPDATAEAAALTGLARADANLRLAGTLPRVLLADADSSRVAGLAGELGRKGFIAFAFELGEVPSDAQRVFVRTLESGPGGLFAIDRLGERHALGADTVELAQRGHRGGMTVEKTEETHKAFSPGRALVTGGLVLTKKVTTTTTETKSNREQFLVVHRFGLPDLVMYERHLDYRFLGPALSPASFANLGATAALLTRTIPGLRVDDRVGRPGFLGGVVAGSGDATDVGLYLVRQAAARGA